MRNYRIYIRFKNKKSKVKRFVDETGETLVAPDVSVIQEPTEILDPSQCLNFEALLDYLPAWTDWLIKNDINSFRKYQDWFLINKARQKTYKTRGQAVNFIPVDDIVPGICFKIVNLPTIRSFVQRDVKFAAIKDCICPLVSVRLTRELTYRFLDNLQKKYHFNNKKQLTELLPEIDKKTILFKPRVDSKPVQKQGVEIDGFVYPFPSEFQIRDRTLEYDSEVIQFIDDWFNERFNISRSTRETAKNINDETDTSIITDIFKNIISELISNDNTLNLQSINTFRRNTLPLTSFEGNTLQSYFEYKSIKYIIPDVYKLNLDIIEIIRKIISEEGLSSVKKVIGGSIIIKKELSRLKDTFPDYEFIDEASLKLYFKDQYLPWLRNKFQVDIRRGQINTELACNFITEGYSKSDFKLSNIESWTDNFTIVKKEENKFDLFVKSIRSNIVKYYLDIETTNIWPAQYKVDLLVLKDNRPIIAYEYDGETHYNPMRDDKEKLLRQFVSDQIENAFFDDIGFPYKRIPRVGNSGIQYNQIIPFIVEDLNNLIYS